MAKTQLRATRDAPFRRPTNLSLDFTLVDEARRLNINVSRACECGLAAQIAEENARQWADANKEAIASYNDFVGQKGLLLADYRQF